MHEVCSEIVWLHPHTRELRLRRLLRFVNKTFAALYRRWSVQGILEDVYRNVKDVLHGPMFEETPKHEDLLKIFRDLESHLTPRLQKRVVWYREFPDAQMQTLRLKEGRQWRCTALLKRSTSAPAIVSATRDDAHSRGGADVPGRDVR